MGYLGTLYNLSVNRKLLKSKSLNFFLKSVHYLPGILQGIFHSLANLILTATDKKTESQRN